MNAHKFVNYELEYNLIIPYIHTEEEIIDMLDERDDVADNGLLEKVDNVQMVMWR